MNSQSITQKQRFPTTRTSIGSAKSNFIKYDVHIVFGFTIVGIILMLVLGKNNGGLWGYGTIVFSLFGLLVFEMAYRSRNTKKGISAVFDVLKHGGPIILIIVCVAWLLALNIIYRSTIESDALPQEYKSFQTLGFIILLTQLYLLYKYLNNDMKSGTGNDMLSKIYSLMSKNLSWLMLLLSIVYLLIIGIMQVILQFFTTDG